MAALRRLLGKRRRAQVTAVALLICISIMSVGAPILPTPGGTHFVACDGSVHFLAKTVEYETCRRLGQRADGLPAGLF